MGTNYAIRNPARDHTYLKFGTLRIYVQHANDDLTRHLEREMGRHLEAVDEAGTHDAKISLIPCKHLPAPPSKAEFVRSETDADVFKKDSIRCLVGASYLVMHDSASHEATVYYRDCNEVYHRVRSSLKWLVIGAAECSGQFYLHAGACVWKERTIIFCGDSGAGKTSSLIRSARLGARLLVDDMVLADHDGIHPIYLGMNIRGDSPKRFSIPEGSLQMDVIGSIALQPQPGPYSIVFVRAWRNDSSIKRSVGSGRAVLQLWKMYEKESSYNAAPQRRAVWLSRAKQFLRGAVFYELLMGANEQQIVAQLRELFEGL